MPYGYSFYDFIDENPYWSLAVAIGGWVAFYFLLYFWVISGQFETVNPVILYAIPAYFIAIGSGAVGQNLYEFLFYTSQGVSITRRQFAEGFVGFAIGGAIIAVVYFVGPLVTASINGLTGLGLSIKGATLSVAVDPVPLTITQFMGVTSFVQIVTSYAFLLFLVVAIAEEFLVLVTYKLIAHFFASRGVSILMTILLSIFIAGVLWGAAHIPAYSEEGVNVLGGVFVAVIVGTLAFRLMSEFIFGDMNIVFMVSSHFAYDFLLTSIIVPLSFVAVHCTGTLTCYGL